MNSSLKRLWGTYKFYKMVVPLSLGVVLTKSKCSLNKMSRLCISLKHNSKLLDNLHSLTFYKTYFGNKYNKAFPI